MWSIIVLSLFIFLVYSLYSSDKDLKSPPSVSWQRDSKWGYIHPLVPLFMDPIKTLDKYTRKYGSVFKIGLGPFKPWYFVTSSELSTPFFRTGNTTLNFVGAVVDLIPNVIGGENFNALNWEQQKTMVRGALWHGSRKLEQVYKEWMIETTGDVLKDHASEEKVDLFELISKIMLQINMRIIFGKEFSEIHKHEFSKVIREGHQSSIHPLSVVLPWLPFGPPKTSRNVRKYSNNIISTFVSDVIEGKISIEEDTYLNHLINTYGSDNSRITIKDKRVIDIVMHLTNVLLTSQTSTYQVISWVIYHLLERPDIVEKVLKESSPYDHLTEACLFESVRLYSNVFAIRRAEVDVDIGGYTLPKGAYILYTPNYGINKAYPHPWDPEKLAAVENKGKTLYGDTWMPFGGLQHPCLGQYLVRFENYALIHTLFSNRKIQLLNKLNHYTWYRSIAAPYPDVPIYIKL